MQLLEKHQKLDVNAVDPQTRRTALGHACVAGDEAVLKILLRVKADVSRLGSASQSRPLLAAAYHGTSRLWRTCWLRART